ncbi:hypothetical protein ACFWSF_09535 [Streptomyces sp. NPDC058611]|uniref:hypothetical protein n=1 Tax=unclassified Streptomyces TaxID=2593676 RepID=UPI003664951B
MPTTVEPFALIMQPDGGFVLTHWSPAATAADTLTRELTAPVADARPIAVDPTTTMWVDGEARRRGLPLNCYVGWLLRMLRHTPEAAYFGPVLFTGSIDVNAVRRGAQGLTEDQALRLIEHYLTRGVAIPAQRTR